MASSSNIENLIQKVTNPLNTSDDPNEIQAICHAVVTESGGVHAAIRLLAHKIQSPQEKEALLAFTVLQACANNCGASFHSELGKFRFLNEMIKLVSPKYLGNSTPPAVKKKAIELLYCWTVDLRSEPKILEAYNMLKEQGVVKDNPVYIGVPSQVPPRPRSRATFEDEEKSKLLQRLLQSKNPDDLHKANILIKSMVKEDERKVERSTRRCVEVETALNNARVLDDMLTQHQQISGSSGELELMKELKNSCSDLQGSIYRLVCEMDEGDSGIEDLLKANDELTQVIGKYKLVIEGTGKCEDELSGHLEGQALLDFSSPEKQEDFDSVLNEDLEKLGLGEVPLDLAKSPQVPGAVPLSASLDPFSEGGTTASNSTVQDLSSIFGITASETSCENTCLAGTKPVFTSALGLLTPQISQSSKAGLSAESVQEQVASPFDDLDILGAASSDFSSSALGEGCGSQFKAAKKLSMNQLKEQQRYKALDSQRFSSSSSGVEMLSCLASGEAAPEHVENPQVDLDLLSSADSNHVPNCDKASVVDGGHPEDDSLLCDQFDTGSTHNDENIDRIVSLCVTSGEPDKEGALVIAALKPSIQSSAKFLDVKPLTDIKVSLASIKPGHQNPIKIIENNGVSVVLHFTQNQPRDDVSVMVVSTTSSVKTPISNYVLQAVVGKGCKVKLQPPSATELCAYSPFLPPPAITQIMLIANPNKMKVALKVMLSYLLEEDCITEMGEVESLPL